MNETVVASAAAAWQRSHFLWASTGYASLGKGNLPRQAKLHPIVLRFAGLFAFPLCLLLLSSVGSCVCVCVCSVVCSWCLKKSLSLKVKCSHCIAVKCKWWESNEELRIGRKRGREGETGGRQTISRQFIKRKNRVVLLLLQTPAASLPLVAGSCCFQSLLLLSVLL